MIYNLLKNKIERGSYNKESLIMKMDVYLLNNRITENQYNELIGIMNAKESGQQ